MRDATEFTKRQTEIAALLIHGLSNKVIGRSLGISEGTVKIQVHVMLEKKCVANRVQLVLKLVQRPGKLVPPSLELVAAKRKMVQLRRALKPFADRVFNENGNVVYGTATHTTDEYWNAYVAIKET